MFQLIARIPAIELRPGMIVSKERLRRNTGTPEIISQFMGKCEKGLHFGSGCYAYQGLWYWYKST